MALELLKEALITTTYINFDDLEVGAYKITKFASCDTKSYGKKITAEFGKKYVFLPKSVADLDDATIEELNKTPVYMIYKGRVPKNKK